MQPTILIIEDDRELGSFLRNLLNDNGYKAFVETTGVSGQERALDSQPDVVLLDRNLPDISGDSICRDLSQNLPDCKILMLTGQKSSADIAEGLNLGADDYLTKPVDPAVLLARIGARLRESSAGTEKTLKVADVTMDIDAHTVTRNGKSIDLSPQEFKLLEYFMRNAGSVLSRDQILTHIWETNPDVETRVVDVYVGYLREKLEFKEPALFHAVRGFGYVMRVEDAS